MFQPGRSNAPALLTSFRASACLSANCAARQLRWIGWGGKVRNNSKSSSYEATTPLAKKLEETGLFFSVYAKRAQELKRQREAEESGEKPEKKTRKPRGKKAAEPAKKEPPKGDRTRVNIVNKKLVNDVLSYLKPSLERHKGCDLISVYPGAGLFAEALHDAVEPRSHLLLEPDEDVYRPFLKSLLKKENTRLLPKSGIVWQDLSEVLVPENLPDQTEIDRQDLEKDPPRNDTLLINMNLAMHPRKKYMLFDSMSRMLVYQLLSSMRTSTLFQKYGQVRMLIWIPDDEKLTILPRSIHGRKKSAIEGELVSEYIGEVCGTDGEEDPDDVGEANRSRRTISRPRQHDLEMMRRVLLRMQEGGFVTPKGRESQLMKEFLKSRHPIDQPIPLTEDNGLVEKRFHKELVTLHKQFKNGELDGKPTALARYKMLRAYEAWIEKRHKTLMDFTHEYEAVVEAYNDARQAEIKGLEEAAQLLEKAKKLNAAYHTNCEALPEYMLSQVRLMQDHLHSIRQPAKLGPILTWDRRPYEPLPVKVTDFYPNLSCSLLDIQPKAMHRALRHIGPGTDNTGDIFDMILGVLLQGIREPIPHLLDQVWPGLAEGIIQHCTKMTDPEEGGLPLSGHGGLTPRAANPPQLLQLLEEFMKWPFRPSYPDLIGRLGDEKLTDDASVPADHDGTNSILGNASNDAF